VTILLTGHSGFIGSRVKALLADRDVVLFKGDLMEEDSYRADLLALKPERCIHLAWQDLPDYSTQTSGANLLATTMFLENLMEAGCRRVVTAGSCFEYGRREGCLDEDEDETQEAESLNAFAFAKWCVYRYLRVLEQHGLEFRHARIFYAYGEGQRETSLIPSVIGAYEEGREPEVTNPERICDFVHVTDVARGLVALLDSDCPSGPYNLGSGMAVTVEGVVDGIARRYGRGYPHSKRAPTGYWANMAKTTRATGFKAEHLEIP
jgi:UDP-glucose 4-epimerase